MNLVNNFNDLQKGKVSKFCVFAGYIQITVNLNANFSLKTHKNLFYNYLLLYCKEFDKKTSKKFFSHL